MTDKRFAANNIIKNHVIWSMGAGAIPVPLLDLAAVTGVQLDMLRQLCKLYGVDHSDVMGKSLIASLTGTIAARQGASLLKVIPGIGTLLGGFSLAIVSGGSTYAVGQVAVNLLDSEGSLFDIDMDKAKDAFKDEFEKGKEYAKDLEKKIKEKKEDIEEEISEVVSDVTASPKKEEPIPESDSFDLNSNETEDIYTQLEKLGALKDKNIITEEEFEAKKQDLLSRL